MNIIYKLKDLSLYFLCVVMIAAPFVLKKTSAHAEWQSLQIWWPNQNVEVNGQQPFKAMLENRNVESYNMIWQVDGGQLNVMYNSYQDYPHKEAIVDVSNWTWKNLGPYKITFKAFDLTGKQIGEANTDLNLVNSLKKAEVKGSPFEIVAPKVASYLNARQEKDYIYKPSQVDLEKIIEEWKTKRPNDAKELEKLQAPTAVWLGGWNSEVKKEVEVVSKKAKSQGALPVFVAYNIPNRDCGGYSAGGVGSFENYINWIRQIEEGMSGPAVVILEPDALALTDCLSKKHESERYELLKQAVGILKSKSNVKVYLDAGHPNWIEVKEMAERLKMAGVELADGFSLNVSNFIDTGVNIEYGRKISEYIGGKHFVIDTGRNGNGALGSEWCNPANRAIGVRPTLSTGQDKVDAYLWIKPPGESDGNCNGGPSAGMLWPEYALSLAQLSK